MNEQNALPNKRFCSHCGTPARADHVFCSNCNARLPGIQISAASPSNTANNHANGRESPGNTQQNDQNQNNSGEKKQNQDVYSGLNYYEILDVRPDASQDEIRGKYLYEVQANHPDKFRDPTAKAIAEEKVKKIIKAYNVLSNVQTRAEYNKWLLGVATPQQQTPNTENTQAEEKYEPTESDYEPQNDNSSSAIESYQQALDLWANSDMPNEELLNNVASLFRLAIGKSKEPFPRAHGYLSLVLLSLDREQEAKKHATLALQQNPNEFRAQEAKAHIALGRAHYMKLGAKDFTNIGGTFMKGLVGENVLGTATSLAFGAIDLIFKSLKANNTQVIFRDEILLLTQIYRNVSQTNTDVSEFLYMSGKLIQFGDIIKNNPPMAGSKPNLYKEILKIPIDKLYMSNREQDVRFLLKIAEGRSMLFDQDKMM